MNYNHTNNSFDETLKSELSVIKTFYKNNQSIINCRNYTTSTYYVKRRNINIKKKKKNIIYINCKTKRKKILVAIHSHTSLFYHRYVFRRIYTLYKNIQLLFFVGLDYNSTVNLKILKEAKKYKDVVIFNFYCDYNTLYILTYKFLKWVEENRKYYDIIIKQDTDTFINIHLIENITMNLIEKKEEFVLGKIWKYNNKERRFPSGMSYTFLSKSINKMLNNSDKIFSKVRNGYGEDLLFGKLAKYANLTFLDASISFRYSIYTKIPLYIKDIKTVYMIHYLRISEIAFFHLILLNKLNHFIYTVNI